MATELNLGDQVTVDCYALYAVGVIVVFRTAQYGSTVHRILDRFLTYIGIRIITESDNRKTPDILLKPNQVLGKVVFNQTQNASIKAMPMVRIKCVLNWVMYLLVLCIKK